MIDESVAGRFTLLEVLGQGGMGTVWRAEDELTGHRVAVKQVLVPSELPAGVVAEGLARMAREWRALTRLDHPNAVRIIDVVEDDDGLYVVMELVEAVSLEDLVGNGGPLPPGRAARIGLQLLDVLTAAHGAGVVHCEVKPRNVLVLPGDCVKLGDFGVSGLQWEARLTGTGAFLGSPAYLAPEQTRGGSSAPASDLWSLGATLYFAVEGRAAFEAPTFSGVLARILGGVPARPAHAGPLEPLLAALLSKDPEARPGPEEIRRALIAGAEAPPVVPPVTSPEQEAALAALAAVPYADPDAPVTTLPGAPEHFEAPVKAFGLVTETASRVVWTLVMCAGAFAFLSSVFGGLGPLGLVPFLVVVGAAGLGRSAYLVADGVTGVLRRNLLEVGPRGIALRRGRHSAGYTWEDLEAVTVARRGLFHRRVLLVRPVEDAPAGHLPLLPVRLTGATGRSPWLERRTGRVALCRLDELRTDPETVEQAVRTFAGPRWQTS
ncbi:serine/threonine-protein kinase [Actinocorallia sp. B10E7]|uniref:serine/threonine-protein kinase n=1 Tax=Actinocorallia sp. B10E7 TaxID=3153558 RepID=UPI00325D1834